MTCDCRKDIEAKLTERFIANQPAATEHGVALVGYAYAMTGNRLVSAPYMPAEARALVYVKKTGQRKPKVFKQNMFFNFCPFCGESLKEPEGASDAK